MACQRTDRTAADAAATTVSRAAPEPRMSALDSARATVGRRYAEHFAAGQGLTREMIHARQAWFTPALAELLIADADADTVGVGYLDADPFVDAQELAARYAVGAARWARDTALVEVTVAFPPGVSDGDEVRHVTVALQRGPAGEWRIADLITPHARLAAGLRAVASERP